MIQEKIENLKRAEVALRNTSLVNMAMLKHNASQALELATELITELVDNVERHEAAMRQLLKQVKELQEWRIKQ